MDPRRTEEGPALALRFADARLEDGPAIAALHNAAAGALTAWYGAGPWSTLTTERGVAGAFRNVYLELLL